MTCTKWKAGLGLMMHTLLSVTDLVLAYAGTNLCKMLLRLESKMICSLPKMLRTIKLAEVGDFWRKTIWVWLVLFMMTEKKENSSNGGSVNKLWI